MGLHYLHYRATVRYLTGIPGAAASNLHRAKRGPAVNLHRFFLDARLCLPEPFRAPPPAYLPDNGGSAAIWEDVPGEDDEDSEEDEESSEDEGDKTAAGLQKALEAERKKRQAAEKKLADREKKRREAEEAAKRKQAEEQGEYQKLYEAEKARAAALQAEVDAFKSSEQARAEQLAARNTERLEALPENVRSLVPEGLSAEQVSSQLDRLEKLVPGEDEESTGFFFKGKGGRGGRGKKIPEACHAAARKAGLKEATETFFTRWKSKTRAGRAWAEANR